MASSSSSRPINSVSEPSSACVLFVDHSLQELVSRGSLGALRFERSDQTLSDLHVGLEVAVLNAESVTAQRGGHARSEQVDEAMAAEQVGEVICRVALAEVGLQHAHSAHGCVVGTGGLVQNGGRNAALADQHGTRGRVGEEVDVGSHLCLAHHDSSGVVYASRKERFVYGEIKESIEKQERKMI